MDHTLIHPANLNSQLVEIRLLGTNSGSIYGSICSERSFLQFQKLSTGCKWPINSYYRGNCNNVNKTIGSLAWKLFLLTVNSCPHIKTFHSIMIMTDLETPITNASNHTLIFGTLSISKGGTY